MVIAVWRELTEEESTALQYKVAQLRDVYDTVEVESVTNGRTRRARLRINGVSQKLYYNAVKKRWLKS